MQANLILGLIFALLIAIFSIQNAQSVSLFLFSWRFEISLVVITLGSMALGALLMGIPAYIKQLKLRRRLKSIEKENKDLEERLGVLTNEFEDLRKEKKVMEQTPEGENNIDNQEV
ncbi:LapA family protein [Halothermothrix orenii]|uniref:Uncharacterized integral membrane protein n=1 Tax=Halothermothrix orenii (strain H 168 / OCM 544 / DSM 9562) TaxID=373903 RepID=B8CXF3_HALOH|nr:LapA family protein [Halothermothrix orenii]ACL69972.1 uncharacterized integral membrane protein [Halothermothrix orenii H 168]